jgi:hypothetical protein
VRSHVPEPLTSGSATTQEAPGDTLQLRERRAEPQEGFGGVPGRGGGEVVSNAAEERNGPLAWLGQGVGLKVGVHGIIPSAGDPVAVNE